MIIAGVAIDVNMNIKFSEAYRMAIHSCKNLSNKLKADYLSRDVLVLVHSKPSRLESNKITDVDADRIIWHCCLTTKHMYVLVRMGAAEAPLTPPPKPKVASFFLKQVCKQSLPLKYDTSKKLNQHFLCFNVVVDFWQETGRGFSGGEESQALKWYARGTQHKGYGYMFTVTFSNLLLYISMHHAWFCKKGVQLPEWCLEEVMMDGQWQTRMCIPETPACTNALSSEKIHDLCHVVDICMHCTWAKTPHWAEFIGTVTEFLKALEICAGKMEEEAKKARTQCAHGNKPSTPVGKSLHPRHSGFGGCSVKHVELNKLLHDAKLYEPIQVTDELILAGAVPDIMANTIHQHQKKYFKPSPVFSVAANGMTFIVGSNKKLVWYWCVPRTAAMWTTEQQTEHATKNADVEFKLRSNILKYAS